MLGATEESVTSALKLARATLQHRVPAEDRQPPRRRARRPNRRSSPSPGALGSGDVDGVVALLTDDVWLTMPPIPLEYQGRKLATRFHEGRGLPPGPHLPGRAHAGQRPACAGRLRPRPPRRCRPRQRTAGAHPPRDRICAMTRFDTSVLPELGLPRTLPH
jgi:hypothetical protein